jgi:hypothetical protein
LGPFALDAHKRRDHDALGRARGFAEWCLHQKSKDISNAAGVCFYENLFDDPKLSNSVIPWLGSFVVENCKDLWRGKISVVEIQKLKSSITDKDSRLRRNVYQTGKIESL